VSTGRIARATPTGLANQISDRRRLETMPSMPTDVSLMGNLCRKRAAGAPLDVRDHSE
jgi:hypothetical protein